MAVKYFSLEEFRQKGYLQEINRQFLHPLGLALQVNIDGEGNETFGGIWDYRDDPEGILFNEVDVEKATAFITMQEEKHKQRMEVLGFVIQPLESKDGSTN